MRNNFISGLIIVVTLMTYSVPQASQELNIVPMPAMVNSADGAFFEITSFTEIWTCRENDEVAEYLAGLLRPATGFEIPVVFKTDDSKEDMPDGSIALCSRMMEMCSTTNMDKGFCSGISEMGEESYSMLVSEPGLMIMAVSPAGLFYGIQTLRQLLPLEIERKETVGDVEWKLPVGVIADEPRFRWRGLMLDVARHFQSKEFVMKYIDTMSLFKLNRLHLHLTDDQGWRLEIKKYPKLTEVGAFRKKSSGRDDLFGLGTGEAHGGFYTQEDMKEIIDYAAKRFVTIVPEIELPGHSQAALASVPGISCTGEHFRVRTQWGVNPEIYCAGREKTFTFLEGVLEEVADLFPGEYIHIGGDEVPKDRWRACEKCQARIKAEGLKDEHELQSYFVTRIEKFINSKGKKIIGWDEILEGGLAPNATVMSWRGVKGGVESAKQKHDVIMSPTSHCYLDYYQSKNENGEEPKGIGGFLPMCKVYSFEPVPEELTTDDAKYILGVQGNVWTEHIADAAHVEYMTYPRAAAIAEAGWTQPERKSWPGFSSRIESILPRLDMLGVNYRRIKAGEENLCAE